MTEPTCEERCGNCGREFGSHINGHCPEGAGRFQPQPYHPTREEVLRQLHAREEADLFDDGQPDEAQEWADYDPDC